MVTFDKNLIKCGIMCGDNLKYVENAIMSASPYFYTVVMYTGSDDDGFLEAVKKWAHKPNVHCRYVTEKFNFSEARNALHRACESEWIFHLDDDERMVVEDPGLFRHLMTDYLNDPKAGGMSINIMSPHAKMNNIEIYSSFVESRMVRVVRREMKWGRDIHEVISSYITAQGKNVIIVDSPVISLAHLGYDLEYKELMEKISRNFKLLHETIKNTGGNSADWFHMGRQYVQVNRYKDAEACLYRALEKHKTDHAMIDGGKMIKELLIRIL